MNSCELDALEIVSCLPNLSHAAVLQKVQECQSSNRRIHNALNRVFSEIDGIEQPGRRLRDAEALHTLFPQFERSEIEQVLIVLGSHVDRRMIACRILLARLEKRRRKRKWELNEMDNDELEKKLYKLYGDTSDTSLEMTENGNDLLLNDLSEPEADDLEMPKKTKIPLKVPQANCKDGGRGVSIEVRIEEGRISATLNATKDGERTDRKPDGSTVPKQQKRYFPAPGTSNAGSSTPEKQTHNFLLPDPSRAGGCSTSEMHYLPLPGSSRAGLLVDSTAEMRPLAGPSKPATTTNFERNLKKTDICKKNKGSGYVNSDIIIDLNDSDADLSPQGVEIKVDEKLYYRLLEIFPEACPKFIRLLCANKKFDAIDSLISSILSVPSYPKRELVEDKTHLDIEEQFQMCKELLPNADPSFLKMKCELYAKDEKSLREFINSALEKEDYPTMKDYLRRMQISAQQKQYTEDFNVEKFLEIFPDPDKYFNDPNRKTQIDFDSEMYTLDFLRNKFNSIHSNKIQSVFNKNAKTKNLVAICKELEELPPHSTYTLKGRRKQKAIIESTPNIPLLQEIAYIEHKKEIQIFLAEKEIGLKIERNIAKAKGTLLSCACCFDEEILEIESAKCDEGCIFCKSCVAKSVEVAFGDGKSVFTCLNNCPSLFSLQTLQSVLKPKLFSRIAQMKQLEELKAAGIEDLENCPFCDFATIPAPEDKLFKCLNLECMKESCRMCKEPSHIPLRCEEVEKDSDVKRRVFVEDKMTEAMLRRCYKCNLKFIKLDGCNKITCSCGAQMCYVCGKPVTDYKHFNGQGGSDYHLCPLYSDALELHKHAALKGAEEAKKEIGANELKYDPTSDLEQHYKELSEAYPQPRTILGNPGIFDNAIIIARRPRQPHHNQHRHRHNNDPRVFRNY